MFTQRRNMCFRHIPDLIWWPDVGSGGSPQNPAQCNQNPDRPSSHKPPISGLVTSSNIPDQAVLGRLHQFYQMMIIIPNVSQPAYRLLDTSFRDYSVI